MVRRTIVGSRWLLVVAGVLFAALPRAAAHPLTFTDTTLTLGADRTFEVVLRYDLDALALGAPLATDDAALVAALDRLSPDELATTVERLRELFRRRVRVRFDGAPAPFEVAFPEHGAADTDTGIPSRLGLTARLTGHVPDGAATVGFFASRAFADVHLTIVDTARGRRFRTILERGARSDPYPLADLPDPPGPGAVAARYLRLGVVHIVPDGLDHMLFVLGLFLLGARLRPLVWQVTMFTLAHALTLSAAALGTISLPAGVVEPLIAMSVAWVAIENVLTERVTPWRPIVVFGFGLLHGLGFAGALGALGLPVHDRLLALVSFNAGIELGQLSILAAAAASLGWFRHRPWYRSRVVIPASSAIALAGIVWAVERTVL